VSTPIAKEDVRPATALRILIVEDNPTDRELLRYLLEARLHPSSEFHEATNLQAACLQLEQGSIDCVLLDLRLPDSAGKETFSRLAQMYPSVPIIVITNTKDRELAIEMIRAGAADYMLKDYTDEEDVFQRIMFAVTKHRQSVRVTPEKAGIFHRLDQAQAKITYARRQKNSQEALQMASADTNHAMADVSRQLFAELQTLLQQVAQQGTQQAHLLDNVRTLNKELLHGRSGRPSMKSQMNLIDHRLTAVEVDIGKAKQEAADATDTQRREALQLVQAKMSNRTKILIAVLTLIGVVSTAAATYFATVNKPPATKPSK
jgi:DNA-binding NarL/FixJ family response regulator